MNKVAAFHEELSYQYIYEQSEQDMKDIIIVVHDQLNFIKKCIDSIYENTKNFVLYLWDNNSMAPTREYLEKVASSNNNVVLRQHSSNLGFIKPNNELVKIGNSPYVILLNSDTEVRRGWDTALIGWLKSHPQCYQVGYEGGLLEANGIGSNRFSGWDGNQVDYICGWCFCMNRETIEKYGLFDEENFNFAYGEDSDLSLRLKEAGFDIYSLHIKLVRHYGNVTSKEVQKELDTSSSFHKNHDYIRRRHAEYLEKKRILLKAP